MDNGNKERTDFINKALYNFRGGMARRFYFTNKDYPFFPYYYDPDDDCLHSDSVSIPVIAIGGAGGINDLKNVLHEGHAHAAAGGSMFVYYGRLKAVLITAPSEKELISIVSVPFTYIIS